MIVADAGVLFAALFDGGVAGERCAERLADEECLPAPEIVMLEVVQTARHLVIAGRLDATRVPAGLAQLGAIVETVGHGPLTDRVWELRENLTAYDAAYAALAEMLDVPLVTADARLARAPGPRCARELISLAAA